MASDFAVAGGYHTNSGSRAAVAVQELNRTPIIPRTFNPDI
jgi:hypothetical protein